MKWYEKLLNWLLILWSMVWTSGFFIIAVDMVRDLEYNHSVTDILFTLIAVYFCLLLSSQGLEATRKFYREIDDPKE